MPARTVLFSTWPTKVGSSGWKAVRMSWRERERERENKKKVKMRTRTKRGGSQSVVPFLIHQRKVCAACNFRYTPCACLPHAKYAAATGGKRVDSTRQSECASGGELVSAVALAPVVRAGAVCPAESCCLQQFRCNGTKLPNNIWATHVLSTY